MRIDYMHDHGQDQNPIPRGEYTLTLDADELFQLWALSYYSEGGTRFPINVNLTDVIERGVGVSGLKLGEYLNLRSESRFPDWTLT